MAQLTFAIAEMPALNSSFNVRLPAWFLDALYPLHTVETYNTRIADKLREQYGLDGEYAKLMEYWVFVGRRNLDTDRKEAERTQAELDGWQVLSEPVFDAAIKDGHKLTLRGAMQHDWLSSSIGGDFKPIVDGKGRRFLIAPRKRTRGYYLNNLVNQDGYTYCRRAAK